ncbi:MAG: AAA family ATPase [Myxococcota bacterium]
MRGGEPASPDEPEPGREKWEEAGVRERWGEVELLTLWASSDEDPPGLRQALVSAVSRRRQLASAGLVTLSAVHLDGETPHALWAWVEGDRLDGRLAQRPLEEDDVVTIAFGLLEALCVLHGAGLVHGAIESAAVALSADGVATLTGGARGLVETAWCEAEGRALPTDTDLRALGRLLEALAPLDGRWSGDLERFVARLAGGADFDGAQPARDALSSIASRATQRPRPTATSPDPFVGRAEALSTLEELHGQRTRLVSIVGPGGIGKTRLAREWRRRRIAIDPNVTVRFVDLTTVRHDGGFIDAVGRSLGVKAGDDPRLAVLDALGARRQCIVLDNAEHLIDTVVTFVGQALEAAPELQVLVTSRRPLGLSMERVLPLPPLERGGAESESWVLFVERARQHGDGFEVPESERDALVALLDMLDGLPLAIELAAARARMLAPAAMLPRLARPFTVLRTSRPGVSPRHASLDAAIRWSWDLLGAPEQQALRQLSVFEGPFSLLDAEAVVQLSPHPTIQYVLDALERLVDSTLVRVEPAPGQFAMLALVRAFARQQLAEADDEAATRRRHLAHVARWGDFEAMPALEDHPAHTMRVVRADLESAHREATPEPASAEDRLRVAIAKLVLDARFGPLDGAASTVAEVADALGAHPVLEARLRAAAGLLSIRAGDVAVARDHLARADRLAAAAPASVRAWVASAHGYAIWYDRDYPTATIQLKAALAVAEVAQDDALRGRATGYLGLVAVRQADFETAETRFAEAIRLARGSGDAPSDHRFSAELAMMLSDLGEHARAEALFETIDRELAARGEHGARTNSLGQLGFLAMRRGDAERATALLDEAIEIAREVGDLRIRGFLVGRRGLVAMERGAEPSTSRDDFAVALGIARRLGERRNEALWLANLARLDAVEGDREQALERFEASRELSRQTGYHWLELGTVAASGELLATLGRLDEARERRATAEAIAARHPLPADSEPMQALAALVDALEGSDA